MDKREKLEVKISILLKEIEEAKKIVIDEKIDYLNNYQKWVESVLYRLQNGALAASKGGVIGTMRGISEYDSLAAIKNLYDAAADVDVFYSDECKEWQILILDRKNSFRLS